MKGVHLRCAPRAWLAVLGVTTATSAAAGPPMIVDDPGTAAPGGWEVIVATEGFQTSAGSEAYALPLLDVTFGLTPTLEISGSLPYVFARPADARSESGFGSAALGFKWRFVDGERLRIAVAPAYNFGVSRVNAEAGGDDDALSFRVGVDVAINSAWHFLAAAGSGVREPSGAEDVDYEWYLGIQHLR